MSAADSAQAAMKAWEVYDANTFASYLSDDFVCTGPLPQPLNKEQYVGYMKAMMTAMPDWSFNAHILNEQGDTVLFVTQITGTHTGDLSLPGLPIISPTGKKIALPNEHMEYTANGDTITAITTDQRSGGGFAGILAQLGMHLPL
jgi:predicted ester cyclase